MDEERHERRRREYWALIDSVLNSAENVDELRNLTEDQVKARHAECLRLVRIANAPDDKGHFLNHARSYTEELTRRETECLTKSLNWLTWAIAIATFIGVALTAWTLLAG